MNDIIESATRAARGLGQTVGPFRLFGLFRRKTEIGLWDLVVSASWLPEEDPESIRLLFQHLKKYFGPDDLVQLSRALILEPDADFIRALGDLLSYQILREPGRTMGRRDPFGVNRHLIELRNIRIGELEFDRAVVIVFEPQAQTPAPSARRLAG